MKNCGAESRFSTPPAPLLVCSLACLLLAGCASDSNAPPAPTPGSGIVEFREVTRQAHRAVAATVESLQTVARQPNGADADFDRAFKDLELTSVKARARAEALISRGQNYFDEWKEHLAGNARPEGHGQADYDRLYN